MINKIFYYMYSSIKVLMYQKIDLKKQLIRTFLWLYMRLTSLQSSVFANTR